MVMSMRGKQKIRPPRRGLATDALNFDETWHLLSESLTQIHERNASSLSFEELYRNAYKLVLKKHGEQLYRNVKDLVARHLQKVAVQKVRPLRPLPALNSSQMYGSAAIERREVGNRFLLGLKQAWEDHQLCMGMITDVLMYMDRVYCTDNKKPSIYVACMGLFRDYVLRNKNYDIGGDLVRVILDQIQMERDGDAIHKATIRSCIYMLEGLYEREEEIENEKVYFTIFEERFLSTSDSFYAKEAESMLREMDAATYVKHANQRIQEEILRCQSTIAMATEPKILRIVEKRLISENIKEVMEMESSGLNFMLTHDKYEDIALMFHLVRRVDSQALEFKKLLKQRIVDMGKEINSACLNQPSAEGGEKEEAAVNNETALALKWVEDVLLLKDKFDKIHKESLEKDSGVQQTMSKAFTEFINTNRKSPEHVSLFVDENIKKGLKGKSEAEVDQVLDKAITLFRYIEDKDIFERYYKKHLSRRLILGRSISNDVERSMISKFKVEVGYSFTTKMEGMFKDMTVSADLTAEYKRHVANLGDTSEHRIELDMKVLTNTFWPWSAAESQHTCTYPKEIERVKASFQAFYLNKHNGRQLTWQPQMGNADIKAVFKNNERHEFNVSTYSMVILLLFNDLPKGEFLSYEDIKTATSIPEQELIRHLQTLAVAPKTRILIKSPMSRAIKPTDKFTFNENFTSKMFRIKIGVVKGTSNKVETEKERKETENKADESKGHLIEAAIVRTMKARNILGHQELIIQITEQLKKRFQPQPQMIKKRIEGLIEREYLERKKDDPNTYIYMA